MGRFYRTERAFGISKLVLASVAVMIGLAAPAHTVSANDDAIFLGALDQAGIRYDSPGQAISAGNAVCQLMAAGKPRAEITWQLVISNQGLSRDTATKFAGIAANVYCPQYLNDLSGNGGAP